MAWLDCHNLAATLAALADAIGISTDELEQALRAYDETVFDDPAEDPWARMPREVLERFGSDVETVADTFEGAYYFHGTRALDPEAFGRRGILPLDQVLDELWATLRELAGDEINDDEWAAFRRSVAEGAGGHNGCLYRLKTSDQIHFGPFGLLVREIFLDPQATGSHDYLGCPEIVQDIARCYRAAHATDLEQRFCGAARPCIVKFRSTQLGPSVINAALAYAYTKLREDGISTSANWAIAGGGARVPVENIVHVEIVG